MAFCALIFNLFQVHQAVIDAGEIESGCTIHQVTETVDGGPIIVQKKVKVSKVIKAVLSVEFEPYSATYITLQNRLKQKIRRRL